MGVTLKEVAEKAGVSRSAVSRTFTSGASVSKETRRKVEKAAKELGYHPSALARALTTGRTKLVGLVSNNFSNPAFLEIFDLFTRGLQDEGLRPLLLNLSGETDAAHSVRMLQQYSVDGVIVASSTIDQELASRFRNAGVPTVQAFGRASSDVHSVGIDNVACGRLAAETLYERGYRKVGFLGGPATATSTQDRLSGFEDQARQFGDMITTATYSTAYSFDAGYRAMTALIKLGGLPEAYFCGDDVLAIGALSAAQDAGIAVPRELGLLGLNDMEMAGWANINMTTIRQPFSEIIGSAIELMVSLLGRPDRSPETRVFSCQVVERKTLRSKAAAEPKTDGSRSFKSQPLDADA